MIRLTALELENFKNVKWGRAILSTWKPGEDFPDSDIIGIYGQNGSGKTSVIQALDVVKHLIEGHAIDGEAIDYIAKSNDSASIQVEGSVFADKSTPIYSFVYSVTITDKGGDLLVSSESLAFKKLDSKKSVLRYLFDYAIDDSVANGFLLAPKTNWEGLVSIDKASKMDFYLAQRLSAENAKSFLFSTECVQYLEKARQIALDKESSLSKKAENAVEEVLLPILSIIGSLKKFAFFEFAVVSTSRQAASMVDYLRISSHEGDLGGLADVGFDVDLRNPVILSAENLIHLENTVASINPVLGALVPGLALDVKHLEKVMTDEGEIGVRIDITCSRGEVTVPLRCESEGIKKLVSILTLLIDVYAKPGACIAIDELDSGIFEFLLGELLEVLQNHGRGQLIFTAHNLRPLEVVGKGSLIFTTTNPENRYIGFQGNQPSNNLRNQYLRAINLGGQPETVYEATSKFKIDDAFYDAGFPQE